MAAVLAVLVAVAISYGFYLSDVESFGGDYTIFIIDFFSQYTAFTEYFVNSSLLEKFYSFSKGLGEQMVGLNAYYSLSPFNLLLLLFPVEKINLAFCVVVICKYILMAESMYCYLNSHYENSFINMVFGFAYAMYPNLIRNYHNIMWLDIIALLPLLILAVERIIDGKEKRHFIILYTCCLLFNYYITSIASLYILCYFFYYYMANHSFNIRSLFVKVRDMAVSVMCSVGLSAPVLLPTFLYLMGGKFASGDASDWHAARRMNLLNLPFALFEQFFINNEFPQMAGSAVFICLLFAFVINRKIPLKKKLWGIGLFAVVTLTLTNRLAAFIATGFSTPAGHYFRNIFVYAFTLLILVRMGIEGLDKNAGRLLSAIAVALAVGAVVYSRLFSYLPFTTKGLLLTAISFGVCIVCLWFYDKKPFRQLLYSYMVVITLLNTGFYLSCEITASRPVHNITNQQFTDKLTGTADMIKSIGDDGFYRIEDMQKYDLNQALMLNYNSMSYFSSDYSEYVHDLTTHFGLPDSFYGTAYRHNVLTDSLFGVKYLLSWDDMSNVYPQVDLGIYHNPYSLPVVFTGPTNQVEYSDEASAHINNMFKSLTDISVIDANGETDTDSLLAAANIINQSSAEIIKQDGALLKIKADGEYLLSTIPYSHDWKVFVNGKPAIPEKFMDSFMSVPLSEAEDNDITMLYIPKGLLPGTAICLITVLLIILIPKYKKNPPEALEDFVLFTISDHLYS